MLMETLQSHQPGCELAADGLDLIIAHRTYALKYHIQPCKQVVECA